MQTCNRHQLSTIYFSIVIMVGRGYFLPTHVHEASKKFRDGPDLRAENGSG